MDSVLLSRRGIVELALVGAAGIVLRPAVTDAGTPAFEVILEADPVPHKERIGSRLDPKLSVANQYAVRGLPATFLIDRKGAVAAVAIGPRDWDGKAAHAAIETLLK